MCVIHVRVHGLARPTYNYIMYLLHHTLRVQCRLPISDCTSFYFDVVDCKTHSKAYTLQLYTMCYIYKLCITHM